MRNHLQVERKGSVLSKTYLPGIYAALIIILLTATAYHSIVNLYFIGPDFKYLIFAKQADFPTILQEFIPRYGDSGYRYLKLCVWKLNYLLWGFEPKGYFIQALLLHCTNAFLIYLLCLAAGGRWLQGLMAGLFFGLFPLNAEAVCWATAIYYRMSTLFYLGALLAYTRWRMGTHSANAYVLSLVFEILAFLTFGGTIMLPVMIWLLDTVLLGRSGSGSFISRNVERMKRCAPHFLIAATYLVFRYGFDLGLSYPEKGMIYKLPEIMEQLLVNVPLVFALPLKQTSLLAEGPNLWLLPLGAKLPALAMLIALALIAWWINRPLRNGFLLAGILWIAVCGLPYWKSLWNLEWDFLTARHLYLAAPGWALFLAALITGGRGRRRVFSLWAAIVIVLYYLFLTTSYVMDWRHASDISRRITTRLKKDVPPASGTRIYLMNIPWIYNGVLSLWNSIDIMQWMAPEEAIYVQRKYGMACPKGDILLWDRFPFKIFILNRSWKLTYFRNEYDKPPKLDPEKLEKLRFGSHDLFFIWDGDRRELRNVTAEIEKMVREGKLQHPFDIYIKSTIWSSPPDPAKMPREEWIAI